MDELDLKKMVDEHWKWVEGLLLRTDHISIDTTEYLYKTAFLHGYKHARKVK